MTHQQRYSERNIENYQEKGRWYYEETKGGYKIVIDTGHCLRKKN